MRDVQDKKILRAAALIQREALSTRAVAALSAKIIQNLIAYIPWKDFRTVHLFISCPIRKEVGTQALFEYLWANQKHITTVTNRIDPLLDELDCVRMTAEAPLEKHPFGIFEPSADAEKMNAQEVDLMILPLLACDLRGFRLGYGKGYYDRLLARCVPTLKRIGINYFSPLEELIPHERHDEPLHELVTPEKIWLFQ